ncbi:MAG: D-alanyl-D-alanine carboxypeptidase [Methylobacillus sp.]|nr:D-alanyl-D-alanine carboxypeptidase [Methylobacillus sp.]
MRFLLLPLLLLAATTFAADDIPPPPTLAAKSYLLMDYNSHNILAQQNVQDRVEPASLTKLMTAYLAFKALENGHLKLDQTLPVSVKAWKGGGAGCGGGAGSCMFIEPNKPVTVDQLLHGMIVISGNDASVALAEGIAGSEEAFASMMNKEAERLGMKNTHFVNSTGLPDPEHYTTAYDLSLLASALVRDFPEQYKTFYSIKDYTFNNIKQSNRNRLLWADPFVDGMKTGHTAAAGFCLISSAKRGDMRLIAILLGAPNDNARITGSQQLLNYGFQFYESRLYYKHGQTISKLKVWKGSEETLDATVDHDLYLALPKGQFARLKAEVVSQQPLIAPIAANQQVGTLRFTLDGKTLMERPLIAAREMSTAGIFGRMWDSIKLWFQ